MMIITDFDYGQKVKDMITGYEGIIVSFRQDLGNCQEYLILPTRLIEGDPPDGYWFPKARIELIEESINFSDITKNQVSETKGTHEI